MSSEWVSVWMVLVLLMLTVLIRVEVGSGERNFSRLQGTNSVSHTHAVGESPLALTNHPAATRLLEMFLILKWEQVTLRLTQSA